MKTTKTTGAAVSGRKSASVGSRVAYGRAARAAGARWIETEGATDCTDAEIREQAERYSDREMQYAFIEGVNSMLTFGKVMLP